MHTLLQQRYNSTSLPANNSISSYFLIGHFAFDDFCPRRRSVWPYLRGEFRVREHSNISSSSHQRISQRQQAAGLLRSSQSRIDCCAE